MNTFSASMTTISGPPARDPDRPFVSLRIVTWTSSGLGFTVNHIISDDDDDDFGNEKLDVRTSMSKLELEQRVLDDDASICGPCRESVTCGHFCRTRETRIDVENFNVANRDETVSQAKLAPDGNHGGEEQDSTHPSTLVADVSYWPLACSSPATPSTMP
ncbi:hypothetical protein AYO20_02666 [Fonsecaea nubica]|uniref:Uncharacterized protein n=1 Tax=Fonsecaea nubica TaxID=856822 RepID=A0A178DA74_9EURO|nr:hypothetical protein AYO20_02666 [Fonsecaea nubica]OAL38214.1 hypothetical protein AYO20_02666 [Fonsecaea nubica]